MPNTAVPTHIKRLSGNPGKRPLNDKEPQPIGAPAAPKEMTKTAKEVWKRLVASMPVEVYTAADTHILAAYCEAVSNHRTATRMIAAKDFEPMIPGSTGQLTVNPIYKLQSDQARLIKELGQRLGLDPIARQQIASDPGDDEDEFASLVH
ncbi:phage terminase small subunit P27 family [Novosphingobium sp. TCA1]|uniref:phage terminase small subunit P27 family n=1 Tax=Novosphingobium sp. TCA1 TaxID=2682474 RepID=UPI00130BE10F|nr:phage terminase small subunit P27 family [Novosphingobium sp. TCA1]GFE77518.1 terminase [Novosphingobium sp. TCA1]